MAPKAAAGQVVSGREYMDPNPVGPGDVASARSDLACTTGKDTGYYSPLNVRASGALYDIRLPIRVLADVVKGGGVVEAIWGAAVWSKSSGKVRVFLSTTGEKWSIWTPLWCSKVFGGSLSPWSTPWPSRPSWPRGRENVTAAVTALRLYINVIRISMILGCTLVQ